ncbi:MAG: hypothetical protein J6J13_03310 [Clostridia bacterium]|nr:hypothetical protein [Clostridia bacterium]
MKQVTIRMSEELYKAFRIKTITEGISCVDYISRLIENDLKKENE